MDAAPSGSALPVHHLAVTVRDLDRAARFYGDVLGLPFDRHWLDATGATRSLWFRLAGGAFLAVERAAESGASMPEPADLPGWHCVALGIAPATRDGWHARLENAGFPVERETEFTLYARDPEGNLVALSHYPVPRGA